MQYVDDHVRLNEVLKYGFVILRACNRICFWYSTYPESRFVRILGLEEIVVEDYEAHFV